MHVAMQCMRSFYDVQFEGPVMCAPFLYLVGGVFDLDAGTVFPRHMARPFGSLCVCPLCMELRSLGTGRAVRSLATLQALSPT